MLTVENLNNTEKYKITLRKKYKAHYLGIIFVLQSNIIPDRVRINNRKLILQILDCQNKRTLILLLLEINGDKVTEMKLKDLLNHKFIFNERFSSM